MRFYRHCSFVDYTMQFGKEELEVSTLQFALSWLVGQGAYGSVYIGQNMRGSATTVAVKVLDEVQKYMCVCYIT